MDQHPIPQNVTGFQFKLIGAMTVKQFGYVAAGVIAAVIMYYIPLKGLVWILLKTLFIPLSGASGAILAFVPIDGRPIDVMVGNFLKALFSPNQYVYLKTTKQFSFSVIAAPKPHAETKVIKTQSTPKQKMINERGLELQKLLIKSQEGKIKNSMDEREAAFLKSFSSPQPQAPSQASVQSAPRSQAAIPKPIITTPPLKKIEIPTPPEPAGQTTESLSEKEAALIKQLDEAKQAEAAPRDSAELASAHQKALDLSRQVQDIHAQKEKLEQEIISLKQQLVSQKTTITAQPNKVDATSQKPTAHVRSIPKEMNKALGLLTSDTPNVIAGMVKDSRGNVLPNILVEIKDKNGNPVRAFKTNTLGNFASATPLAQGSYTITLEDPKKQHTFDSIQITAVNQIMLPIEIISYDKREELRKDLFS